MNWARILGWFKRHKVWSGIIFLIIFLILLGWILGALGVDTLLAGRLFGLFVVFPCLILWVTRKIQKWWNSK